MTLAGFSSTYTWCGRCQCVYPAVTWVENNWGCPNPTCKGWADDAWAWGETILAQHPEYPEEPEVGERYPL